MLFVASRNNITKQYHLTSRGTTGKPNVEQYESLSAIEYKMIRLKENGHNVTWITWTPPKLK